MATTNKAMIIRRELVTKLTKLLMNDELVSGIDRIPVEIRPKNGEISRCCVYKDRAMIKYKLMAMMGFNTQEEDEEITPLSEFAKIALSRNVLSKLPLTVINEACSACVKVNYVVTNMCRGCVARPCIVNCPKDAINFENGRADIESKKCVNCGLCQKNCPFHAIVYMPVPCEESCPVGAITKDENGIEHIDDTKCIYCGRCIVACPFGAVMEKSHLVEIVKAIKSDKKVISMVAPAIAGQFRTPLGKIMTSIKKLGFDDVIEVAKGADVTTDNEAKEFIEKMEQGQAFMTTSCCPSYTATVYRHVPELLPYISHTKTPMYYTAEIVRKENPDAVTVFIGPCLAKRYEVTYIDPNTDYMLSFEELGSMLIAMGIDIAKEEELALDDSIYDTSRGYAVASGVAHAVQTQIGDKYSIKPIAIDGLDKSKIRELKGLAKNCHGNMVEIMACEGGCINGCNVIANPKVATRQIKEIAKRG